MALAAQRVTPTVVRSGALWPPDCTTVGRWSGPVLAGARIHLSSVGPGRTALPRPTGALAGASGWFRLAGPLLLGTALAVATTVHESLAALATVPTWAWQAAGGCTLLAVGVTLERKGQSPADAGRRLVDVVAERFD